jgi:dTDP-4-dehydrorhamnose 3,5-epimerase
MRHAVEKRHPAQNIYFFKRFIMPVQLITPKRFGDSRGWFSETYVESRYAALGVSARFMQDNHSFSQDKGTIRGLHFQKPPHAQAKLVRCLRGSIFDVAVDIRAQSPTFGQWVGAILSAENGAQLYIPEGFAHGFCTLEDNTEVAYKVSAPYAPQDEGGVHYADVTLAIAWPSIPEPLQIAPLLSDKDMALPVLKGFLSPFTYDNRPLLRLAGQPCSNGLA